MTIYKRIIRKIFYISHKVKVAIYKYLKPFNPFKTLKPHLPFVDKFNKFEKPYSLHLGCGTAHADGYCNVDIVETSATDVLDDISALKKFPNSSAKEIYASHVLEHFSHVEIIPILKRWYEVLHPGGIIRISVPDIDKIVKIYFKHLPYFQHEDVSPWIGLIYGGQSSQYDYHKTGFNANWLKSLLESAGFINCEEYPHSPHFIPGLQDDSLGNATFNEYISLNMRALKPY